MYSTLVRLMADGLLLAILALAAVGAYRGLPWKQWRYFMPYGIMASLTSLLVGKLASLIYQPDVARPFVTQGIAAGAAYINNPGFPSDHMLLATVVIGAVYFLTPYRRFAALLAVLALVMATARVVALVHTPIDIAGGIVFGASGFVWYACMKRL